MSATPSRMTINRDGTITGGPKPKAKPKPKANAKVKPTISKPKSAAAIERREKRTMRLAEKKTEGYIVKQAPQKFEPDKNKKPDDDDAVYHPDAS